MALARKRASESIGIAREAAPNPEPSELSAGLRLARVRSFAGDVIELDVAGRVVRATRDASLDPAVLETACATGERVLVEVDEQGVAVVVGALRTKPVPGVDRASSFVVEANSVSVRAARFEVEADDEAVIASKTARLVLRAAGEIESFAERIVSRASGVHKIVGRMLRLN